MYTHGEVGQTDRLTDGRTCKEEENRLGELWTDGQINISQMFVRTDRQTDGRTEVYQVDRQTD